MHNSRVNKHQILSLWLGQLERILSEEGMGTALPGSMLFKTKHYGALGNGAWGSDGQLAGGWIKRPARSLPSLICRDSALGADRLSRKCHTTQLGWSRCRGRPGPSGHAAPPPALPGSCAPPLQGEALTGTLRGVGVCGSAAAETGRASTLLVSEGRGFGNRNIF